VLGASLSVLWEADSTLVDLFPMANTQDHYSVIGGSDGGLKAEGGGRLTEDGGQMTDDGGRIAEVRGIGLCPQ
jgi:hypothetical protein